MWRKLHGLGYKKLLIDIKGSGFSYSEPLILQENQIISILFINNHNKLITFAKDSHHM